MLKLPEIYLSGTAYERGYKLGSLEKDAIQLLVKDTKDYITFKNPSLTASALYSKITDYIFELINVFPDIDQEIKGISDGAAIEYEDAYLLQLRRELVDAEPECSSIGYFGDNNCFIAQNVDLSHFMKKYGRIVHTFIPEKNLYITQYTQVGVLGYLGINSHKISIGINMVNAPGWRLGIPIYLLVYHLLQQDSIESCITEIEKIKRASSRSLLIMDSNRLINVEMSTEEVAYIKGNLLFHTNHYLHEKFEKFNYLNKNFASFERLTRLKELFETVDVSSLEELKKLLRDHEFFPDSICAHSLSPNTKPETIASVIMFPQEQKIFASQGNPCMSSYYAFDNNRWNENG